MRALLDGCASQRQARRVAAHSLAHLPSAERVPAVLAVDYACLPAPPPGAGRRPPTLCVEIKPKWGFLPLALYPDACACAEPRAHSAADDHDVSQQERQRRWAKAHVCRYCMLQPLKLHQGKIAALSGCAARLRAR